MWPALQLISCTAADEMWRLLEKLAVVKGKAHPIFQVKPEDQLNGMLQRRSEPCLISLQNCTRTLQRARLL